ncbi:hypothetical protein Gotur_023465 [Gossypium turneri]
MKQYIQVRHAQGIHNVDGDKNYKAYMSPEYFDAHITPLGWQQVDNLRKHVHECGLAKRIDLVITSPLLRELLLIEAECDRSNANGTTEFHVKI